MVFKVHARSVAALKQKAAVPKEEQLRDRSRILELREEVLKQREEVCKACRFWFEEIGRCMHHNCGCPRSKDRLRPWAVLPVCPDGKW